MNEDKTVTIDETLVRRLVATQFPRWADLPVAGVEPQGWDNRTFRLGQGLAVRLPSAARYVPQVQKEHRWLPLLAPRLPLAIPEPVAIGVPGEGYPWSWSIYRWRPGDVATDRRVADTPRFAADLGHFLGALQAIDASGGPPAGEHSFHRGGDLSVYEAQTRASIATLAGKVDAQWATRLWEQALSSRWDRLPVWVHGDIATGNLLVEDGRLSAVIDFGGLAVGDPACDLVIAWTFFDAASRTVFRDALPDLDEGCWDRAKGWALWKSLLLLADHNAGTSSARAVAKTTVQALVSDDQ